MDENTSEITNNDVPTDHETKNFNEINDETSIIEPYNNATEDQGEKDIESEKHGKETTGVNDEYDKRSVYDGEVITGEELGDEQIVDEQVGEEQVGEEQIGEEQVGEVDKIDEQKVAETEQIEEEEEGYIEEPPPDPTAPLDLSESKEILKAPYSLRPDQIAEVEQLWEIYQNYTPAYTDIDGYITEKELVYMLKALLLMTYTPEQLQELITFCVRPPHPQGHINYEQFLKIVTLRQRDFPIEDELRSALQVFDPGRTGSIDREYLKDVLAKQGHKMPQKQLDNLIKEVDISNDGTIGIEDVVGTMCIDLNKDDILMLMASLNPDENSSKHS